MSTDLYGVHVLEVAPEESRIRFRVYVVYYETDAQTHPELPDDASFFVSELWQAARYEVPLTSLHALRRVTTREICDEGWLGRNTHRFVRRIEQVSTRNHPVPDEAWPKLHDFYYERDNRWKDTHLLVQADFDVHVTDPRYLAGLTPGKGWGTTSYAVPSDQRPETDEEVPYLGSPAVVLDPFPGDDGDAATPSDVAFSDDGHYLAVTNQACELAVFRTEDWTEHLRVPDSPLWGQDVRWIPGTHRIAGRVIDGEPDGSPGRAFDVDTGAETEGARQPRETPPLLRTPEGRRLLAFVTGRFHRHSFRPGGEYLVAVNDEDLTMWRVEDGDRIMLHRTGGESFRGFAWSPDGETLVASVITGPQGYGGEFRVYRRDRPAEPEPTVEELRALAEEAGSGDEMFFLDLIAECETDPAALARIHRERGQKLQNGDLSAAAEAFRRSVELGGTTNALHASFDLSLVLRALGKTDEATDAARTAHRIASGRDLTGKKNKRLLARTCLHLADLLRNHGGPDATGEARDLYREAADLGVEKTAWAYLGLAWLAFSAEDNETAEPLLLKAVELAGEDAHTTGWASVLLGCVAKERRDVSGALRWFKRAMEADDGRRGLATGHLGELYYLLGEREEAVGWYHKMLKATKEPELVAEGCFRIGEIAAADGERAKARTFLRRAVRTGDRNFGAKAQELLDELGS